MGNLRVRVVLAFAVCAFVALTGAACKSGPEDATITASVKTKMAADSTVPAMKINVDTKEGVVTLTGDVDSAATKTKAETIAKGVEGVKSVTNSLTVKPPAPTPPPVAAGNDAAIKKAIEDNLAKNKVTGVTVAVEGGVATLTGTVAKGNLIKARQSADEATPKPTKVVSTGLTEK